MENLEDKGIIELFNARDEAALRAVSRKYGTLCMGIAQNILQNYEDAKECVNDTFLKAWESIPPAEPKNLTAYLARIARNIALDKYKYFHREKRGSVSRISAETDDIFIERGSVEQRAERAELISAINGFLRKSSSKSRMMFMRRYWLCESISELAERFHTSENSVSATLSRTRGQLKKYLKKRGFEIE